MNQDKKWLNRKEALAFLKENNLKQISKYKFAIEHNKEKSRKICRRNIWCFSERYLFYHDYAKNHFWGTYHNLKRAYRKEKAEKAYRDAKTEQEKGLALIDINKNRGSTWESHTGQINPLWFLSPIAIYLVIFHLIIKLFNWKKLCGKESRYDINLLKAIINNKEANIDHVIYDYQKKQFFMNMKNY